MAKVLIVGCGDLGSEVVRLLAAAGHDVIGVRASDKVLPNGTSPIQADVTSLPSLKQLEDLMPNLIIYCISADAQTDESYKAHYVDGLRNVIETQRHNTALQHVFFISSTRVYGQKTDKVLNENDPALPNDFGGERLLEAESLLKRLPCSGTAIRLSGIYGPGRLYLIKMVKDLSRWPSVNRWTNRIHREDAARFIAFLCHKKVANEVIDDCYIVTDDQPVLIYEVLIWLAKELKTDAAQVDSQAAIVGKPLGNQRMHELGFHLKYPNYQLGYKEVIKGL